MYTEEPVYMALTCFCIYYTKTGEIIQIKKTKKHPYKTRNSFPLDTTI